MTLGEKLKEARKQACLSQEQLSEKLGVSRSAVAKWETDNGIPDVDNLKVLSTTVGSGTRNSYINSEFSPLKTLIEILFSGLQEFLSPKKEQNVRIKKLQELTIKNTPSNEK